MNMNFVTAAGIGVIVTFVLLLAMEGLIRMTPGFAAEERKRYDLTLGTVGIDSEVNTDIFEIIDIDPPPKTPQEWQPPEGDELVTGINVPRTPAPVPPPTSHTGWQQSSDNPLINIIRVSPQYPTDGLTKGISGWVIVEFDVMTDGTVANARAVDYSHRAFVRNSLKAIQKFKYKARVIDGVPQAAHGLQFKFTFEVED